MANIEIDVDVVCATCNNVLEADYAAATVNSPSASLVVTPCDRCLDNVRDEGHAEGAREAEE